MGQGERSTGTCHCWVDVDLAPLAELVAIVDEVESRFLGQGNDQGSVEKNVGEPPLDSVPVERAAVELAADVAGLVAAVAARLLHWTPVAPELAAAVSVVDSTPRLRGYVEYALGPSTGDTVITVANAAVQALAGGFVGLVVDSVQRGLVLVEAVEEAAAWRQAWGRYFSCPSSAGADPVVVERPTVLNRGPVEEWADSAAALGLSGFGVALPATGDGWRAAGLALSALPKAGRAGREAFSARLGRTLARRGAVIVDPDAVRRLDRIGTIVIDVDVLQTGRWLPGSVHALPGADQAEVVERVHTLFSAEAPESLRSEGRWVLGPIDELTISGRRGVRERRRLEATGATVLGLARGVRLMALLSVVPELNEWHAALASACRRGGSRLVLAGDGPGGAALGIHERLPGGPGLLGTVRSLQADGTGLLLVSSQGQALANADVGVGVSAAQDAPAWGGHILVGHDLGLAVLLINACSTAAAVSRDSVQLARAGTAVGAVAAAMSGTRSGAFRSLLAVNTAAGLALALGVRMETQVARRPVLRTGPPAAWHAMPPASVLERLDSSIEGLAPGDVRRLQDQAEVPGTVPMSLQGAVLEELANPLTPILATGAALSAAIGAVVDAGLIIGVTLLSAVIGGVQRRHTDRAMNALMAESALFARVKRSGTEHRVPAVELVPGDLVQLGSGDVVPADCRLIETAGLEVDESSLTGESYPVAKAVRAVIAETPAERSSMVYEGTTVAAGRASAVVVATGTATEAGRGAAAAREGAPLVGVERRLATITSLTLPATLASAVAVVAAGLARGNPLRRTVRTGVSLAVAAVPEGLPFLVTAAQMAAARRLSTQGALVRNPRTIEALGRANVLCFDKTGTLTEGRIRLEAVSAGTGDAVALTRLRDDNRAVLAAALRATPESRRGSKLEHFTDRAVTKGGAYAGVVRAVNAPGWMRGQALPFEPARGYHATTGFIAGRGLLSVKGAPERVLPRCLTVRDGSVERPLDGRSARMLSRHASSLAHKGFRVLAVAERTVPGNVGAMDDEQVRDLTFLGFLALSDPIKETAAASIQALRDAGVQVIMITGDHPGTASSVADRLDLINGGRIITGPELDRLSDDALDQLLPSVSVVARGTPAHKVRVVQSFQRLKRTVAMTGDGANDAPAIRLADVGIALGRRGTQAARVAADLVVTDDRLETIIGALVEGRSMWGSVRQALGILVGGNLGEIVFTVLGAALTGLSPLGARQLLLVNLLTDLAPALAVALRPPHAASTRDLLAEGPEASLGPALTRNVSIRALVTAGGAAAAWLAAIALGMGSAAPTIALVGLVATQLAQTLVSGTPTPGVIGGGLGSLAALAVVVQQPLLAAFFGSTPLTAAGWAVAAAAAAAATALSLAAPRIAAMLQQSFGPCLQGLKNDRCAA